MRLATIVGVCALMLSGAAQAEVVDRGAYGFRLKVVRQIAAPPEKVFAAIGQVGSWWSDAHSYSRKASNMTLPLTANACFCETLPAGGGVRHGEVEAVIPNQLVRVRAALGPLQDEGVGADLAFNLKARDGGTELTTTYNVGGAREAMVAFAPGVDGVITDAMDRLKSYVETGKPK